MKIKTSQKKILQLDGLASYLFTPAQLSSFIVTISYCLVSLSYQYIHLFTFCSCVEYAKYVACKLIIPT